MPTTSPTRLSGPLASRRMGTVTIDPGSYVAFKIDPHATLAVLGDPLVDVCTKELLESEHNKVYLGLVLEAHLIGRGYYQLTLSVIGPKPGTLPQDSADTFVPIFSSRAIYDYSIAHYPVFPRPPLSYKDAYHYPKVLRAKVSATVFPEDCRLFPDGFPKLKETDVKRVKDYANHHAQQINEPDPGASQGNRVLQELKPMDMAAQIAQVKTAIQGAPLGAFDPETPWERRDRLWLLEHETDPTLPGRVLSWEPVITIWMDPSEAGRSLTLPKMLDPELAVLKRVADTFNRRWIEWVRELYVKRTAKPVDLPPIYNRQARGPSRTVVMVKITVPPSELTTQDVATKAQRESGPAGEKSVAAKVIIPSEVAPEVIDLPEVAPAPASAPASVLAKSLKSNRPDRRADRLRDAEAAITRLTTASKFVSKSARLAALGSYYAANYSFKAVRYAVDGYFTLTGRPVRRRLIKARMDKLQSNSQQGN